MIDSPQVWETVRERAPIPEGTQAALLVGSQARGWANAGSDMDVVVVATTPPPGNPDVLPVPLDPPCVPFVQWHVGSVGWEVKYWLIDQVEQMLGKVTWDAVEGNQAAGQSVTEQEELFLERLFSALPLYGAEWLGRVRSRLSESAFRTLVVSRSLGHADKSIADAVGQAEAGDVTSATLSARSAFGHTVDALLESHDVYGSLTVKWRARRVREAALQVLPFDEYWAVETMADLDRDDPRPWVTATVRRVRRLMMSIEM